MKINQLLKVGLYNLVIVAILGVIMRYKIGFELPIVNQKIFNWPILALRFQALYQL